MWDETTQTMWIELKTALYRRGGLYPDVCMRDAKRVFPIRKVKISRGGFRVVFVREIDVEAIRAMLDSTAY
jgi:hypothetical protein